MKKSILTLVLCTIVLGGRCLAQEWEGGVGGGFSLFRNPKVKLGSSDADAGLKPGPVFSAFATQRLYDRLGGEIRYTFGLNDMKVSTGSEEHSFSGQSHAVHYELHFYGSGKDAAVQPYAIGGGGLKVYRGTGKEEAVVPLMDYAILTKTQQITGLVVFGGGVRFKVGEKTFARLEVRDYLTPVPKEVIAPSPGAKMSGWIHGFTPMVSVSFSF